MKKKSVHDRGADVEGEMQILNLPAPVVPPAREDDKIVGD